MKSTTKIITIIVVFAVGSLLITILKETSGNKNGGGGGPIGIIITLGIIAAIRAIWKHNKESDNNKDDSTDNQQLDKQ